VTNLVELDVGGPKNSGPVLREIFTLGGMGGNFTLKLRGWLEAAGLEAVEQRLVDCPAGARNARADLVAKSINGICGAVGPLIAMAKGKTSFLFVRCIRGMLMASWRFPSHSSRGNCLAWVSMFVMS
jgi:hypothetical protein